jgi:hypothetical protein
MRHPGTKSLLHLGPGPDLLLVSLLALLAPALSAQNEVQTQAQATVGAPGISAKQWASEAAVNQLKVLDYGRAYLRYKLHSIDAKGDMIRDTIQTRDGVVARLILRDGKPLTPQQDADEHSRLQAMIDSPYNFSKHVKNDVAEKKTAMDLIRQLPEAMLYTYAPGQPQRPGHPSGAPPEIVLDFKPNPAWHPPTLAADALTGLEGRVWIDPKARYMTRMDADIFRGVNFGFGFLAHIYEGGKLMFEQAEATPNRWIFSRFVERLTIRVVVKTLKQNSDLNGYDFTPVPEMPYQEAIKLLWATPLPQH